MKINPYCWTDNHYFVNSVICQWIFCCLNLLIYAFMELGNSLYGKGPSQAAQSNPQGHCSELHPICAGYSPGIPWKSLYPPSTEEITPGCRAGRWNLCFVSKLLNFQHSFSDKSGERALGGDWQCESAWMGSLEQWNLGLSCLVQCRMHGSKMVSAGAVEYGFCKGIKEMNWPKCFENRLAHSCFQTSCALGLQPYGIFTDVATGSEWKNKNHLPTCTKINKADSSTALCGRILK